MAQGLNRLGHSPNPARSGLVTLRTLPETVKGIPAVSCPKLSDKTKPFIGTRFALLVLLSLLGVTGRLDWPGHGNEENTVNRR